MPDKSTPVVHSIEDLLEAACAGDRRAERRLARACEKPAFVAAYGVYPVPDKARLAAQYALGQVLLKLREGVEVRYFNAYLRRAAVNAAIVLLRKDGRYVHLADFPEPVQEKLIGHGGRPEGDPEKAVWRRQIRDRVLRALQRLPERQRLAFTHVELEGLSYGEAARVMDCDSKTVGSQLFRARERLRELLGDLVA